MENPRLQIFIKNFCKRSPHKFVFSSLERHMACTLFFSGLRPSHRFAPAVNVHNIVRAYTSCVCQQLKIVMYTVNRKM